MTRRADAFQTIHSEGGLLPPDLLRRLLEPKEKLPGTQPADYGLAPGERLNEVLTQSWNRLRRHWAAFREAAANLAVGQPGDALTNDLWNLPLLRELGFGVLPFHPGQEINGRLYPIHYQSGPTPIHLIGCGRSLDRRVSGVQGNPHGLVQEFLNRSPDHVWALVANGLRLRVLRDSQALSRQSYLEFDLEALFDGEVYADFVLLWLVAHATRFVPQEAGKLESCWLEQWTKLANEQGARALGDLRQGVERALQTLGQGLVGHPRNTALQEALRDGTLALNDLHGQLLRVVYRLIFLFVAEDRTLDGVAVLHPRLDSPVAGVARGRYTAHYSTARLRQLAGAIKGSRHGDLWQQFNLLVGALSGEERFASAREALALPALGSWLWNPASTTNLNAASLTGATGVELSNADFLEALRQLAFTRQGKLLRPVDYKHLGAEELGGVYESLLALTPRIEGGGARFTFAEFAGNERKTSGSYYTPDSLVQCLLDSALDPVVEAAIAGKTGAEAEQALLALKVCDPAVGSGHFLVGAAHRLARHLARVRAQAEGDSEASPLLYQTALREVIGRCLYGVDVNPMSAELCRVNLWLEALEPGKPLSFLDHHIRVGNSLLGATPELIAAGIPDEAFKPMTGDDPAFCREYKKQNQKERKSRTSDMFGHEPAPWERMGNLATAMAELEALNDDTVAGIQAKQVRYAELVRDSGYLHGQLLADAWCAAFVWKKCKEPNRPYPILDDLLRKIEQNPFQCPPWMREEIGRLATQYQFFHWHLAFPEVFANGGFDVVLGNPPWERVKLQEKEWFAERSPEIANAPNAAARKRLIAGLKTHDSTLYQQFLDGSRQAEGES
nr:N-6 DNA methylase [Candidatus Contendobacter sp.]